MNHPTSSIKEENPTEILDKAAEIVYDRPDSHGEPEDSFKTIAEMWNGYLRGGGIPDPNIRPHDVANMMVLLKVARNAEGHYHEDNYVDIAGYAENGARLHDD
jgi:hypothetical protein